MLKSIDVLIGLTVILLALSMAVTVITQSITTLLNSRGRHLRRGLEDVLQQLDPALDGARSREIAAQVLMHPLVSGSNVPTPGNDPKNWLNKAAGWVRRFSGRRRLGNVVHREEFTKLLLGLACDHGTTRLDTQVKDALATALANNGVANPDATLKSIRALALQLERSSPELSNTARQNIAILHAAESDFVAKINNWFDQTMDRTSQRFTASTRAITFVGAFIVAFGLQVDTPLLVNRLAADDTMRAAFVKQGQSAQQQPSGQSGQTDQEQLERNYRAFLATNGIIRLPSSEGWLEGFRTVSFLGMLVTALLLSLGAPFWYGSLGRLLQLRSVIAAKDDAQRTERQTTTPLAASAPGQLNATPLAGERGDLAAVG